VLDGDVEDEEGQACTKTDMKTARVVASVENRISAFLCCFDFFAKD